jgi:hypothetical protein
MVSPCDGTRRPRVLAGRLSSTSQHCSCAPCCLSKCLTMTPMGTALSGCSRTPAERQRPWDAERSRFTKEVTGLNPVSPTVGTRHLGRNSVGSTFSSPLRV